jgi:excinuclease ABC subunit A
MDIIRIQGAKTHNLQNITVNIPRDKLVVITGLSGSGKSSLAFDTLYAEGQRRYVESLSSYARQFLSMMEKPDVEHIEGLSPAIAIEQKSTSHNPRSTVGTVTEIYDYLRLLYARVGEPYCPEHNIVLNAQTISQMVDNILSLPLDTKIMILSPVVRERKGEHIELINTLKSKGFVRARINEVVQDLDQVSGLNLRQKHTIEIIIDRLKVRPDIRERLAESLETAVNLSGGLVQVGFLEGHRKELLFSAKFSCPHCGYSLSELEPRLFSFNNPAGACQTCDGLGVKQFFDPQKVVQQPALSLGEGAVRGWDKRSGYYFSLLKAVAKHYKFDINNSFQELSSKHQNIILYGSDDTEIQFRYENDKGSVFQNKKTFEGIIHNFERRYKDTDSNMMREELSKFMSHQDCTDCNGTRLKIESRNVFIAEYNISRVTSLAIHDAVDFFEHLKLGGFRGEIADKILKEIIARLNFLQNVGLEYLTLDRSAETLSGGEAQRIRLASQIGSALVGVMYVLDEPSIGLHQRDNSRLLKTLTYLRDLGNTVIVVEHDEEAIMSADHVIDLGPGAGVHGGKIVAQGSPKEIIKNKNSLTADYLSGKKSIFIPAKRRKTNPKKLIQIKKAKGNNLKNLDVNIPIGLMTCVTGVSGSGKSTLINDTLYPVTAKKLNGASYITAAAHHSILGLEHLDKVIDIDQAPIGRTPRSNAATYTGMFTPIRELFAGTQEARARGYDPGRFSFNVKGGRCESCQGDGVIKVEMHFLPDMYVKCDICAGKRYNRETLEILYKHKNIFEVLDMTVEDARVFFDAIPPVSKKCQTLIDVGLSYIRLGQSATTLSGGEAQRVKLSKELSKRDTGNTLYILDEPTTGLHFHDIAKLLEVLHRLCDQGNTIVIIEHNLDVIKTADWIIDLGPEGGNNGGEIIAEGSPETVAKMKKSYTGQYLNKILK